MVPFSKVWFDLYDARQVFPSDVVLLALRNTSQNPNEFSVFAMNVPKLKSIRQERTSK